MGEDQHLKHEVQKKNQIFKWQKIAILKSNPQVGKPEILKSNRSVGRMRSYSQIFK